MATAAENIPPECGNWIKCFLALNYLRSGLQQFLHTEIEHQHQTIVKALTSQFELTLVHCCQSKVQPEKICTHKTKLHCKTCDQRHCAGTLICHLGPCSWTECLKCKETYCELCSASSHVMAVCDCTAKTILPHHNKSSCKYEKCNCKKQRTRPCDMNWCGYFYEKILNSHKMYPCFENCRPHLWKEKAWEFAKCFTYSSGFRFSESSDDVDINGLISIILNNTYFQTKFQTLKNFEKVCK